MKTVLRHLFITLLLAFSCLQGMGQTGPVSSIQAAMRSGDAAGIAQYIDNTADITIINTQGAYSRAQAEMVLRDFFSRNQPKDFTCQHKGTGNNTVFSIGFLHTTGGKYRVYVLLKQKDNGFALQEIRFER